MTVDWPALLLVLVVFFFFLDLERVDIALFFLEAVLWPRVDFGDELMRQQQQDGNDDDDDNNNNNINIPGIGKSSSG